MPARIETAELNCFQFSGAGRRNPAFPQTVPRHPVTGRQIQAHIKTFQFADLQPVQTPPYNRTFYPLQITFPRIPLTLGFHLPGKGLRPHRFTAIGLSTQFQHAVRRRTVTVAQRHHLLSESVIHVLGNKGPGRLQPSKRIRSYGDIESPLHSDNRRTHSGCQAELLQLSPGIRKHQLMTYSHPGFSPCGRRNPHLDFDTRLQ